MCPELTGVDGGYGGENARATSYAAAQRYRSP